MGRSILAETPTRNAHAVWVAAANAAAAAAVACAAGLSLSGCFDEVPDPTQGFLRVDWGAATQVEVYVDDELVGIDPGVIGPLDAGTYRVRVVREGYIVQPADEMDVVVVPAETVIARFGLVLEVFERTSVTAVDELTGAGIDGAEVFRETAPGTFLSTGVFTPGVVDSVPLGPTRFFVRKSSFEDSPIVAVDIPDLIDEDETVPVQATLGPLRAVLIEMFTYVVCPNCPYAADSILAVRADFPGEVFAVEWHSGVPSLPLYDARWEAREIYYSGGSTIGYPATTIGGELPFLVGGQTSDLSEYRPRSEAFLASCASDCPIALRLEGTIGKTSADLAVRVKWRGGSVPGNLMLRVVITQSHVLAPGNQPEGFDFVPRTIAEVSLGLGLPGEIQVIPVSLPIEDWPYSGADPELAAVAFIQSDATQEILAVSGIP